nr:hypothetical protein [Tanacetum cinerariifolium]
GHRIVGVKWAVTDLTERVAELERDNMRLRGTDLILLYTRMVLDEEDIVERFIGWLPDNIQRNVIVANPARLQDAIHIVNQLMDKKL